MTYTGLENLSNQELVSRALDTIEPCTPLVMELAARLVAACEVLDNCKAAIEAAQGLAEVARGLCAAQGNDEPWEFLRDAEGRCERLATAIESFEEKDPGI
jgi:hypothetical protein